MANLVPPATNNKCLIDLCPFHMCQNCWHWHNSEDPKPHKCEPRDKPNRDLAKTCPNCRHGMAYHGKKTWAERDAADDRYLKLHYRIDYLRQHPRPGEKRRPQVQVRSTRGTNAARTVR